MPVQGQEDHNPNSDPNPDPNPQPPTPNPTLTLALYSCSPGRHHSPGVPGPHHDVVKLDDVILEPTQARGCAVLWHGGECRVTEGGAWKEGTRRGHVVWWVDLLREGGGGTSGLPSDNKDSILFRIKARSLVVQLGVVAGKASLRGRGATD